MNKQMIPVFTACVALAVAAAPARAGLFSASGTVIAILAGELFIGEAEGHLNGAGTLAIRSQRDPALTCSGQFTSDAWAGGNGKFSCSDGATAIFHFQRMTIYRGYGAGDTSRGPMTFSYGLTSEEAAPYLKLPEGKKLAPGGSTLTLIDR